MEEAQYMTSTIIIPVDLICCRVIIPEHISPTLVHAENMAESEAFHTRKQITRQSKDLLVEFNGVEMSGWRI